MIVLVNPASAESPVAVTIVPPKLQPVPTTWSVPEAVVHKETADEDAIPTEVPTPVKKPPIEVIKPLIILCCFFI